MHNLLAAIQKRFAPNLVLSPDTPLISSGLISSFDLQKLLLQIEALYQVRIDAAAIGVDNFDTVNQIYSYLQQLPKS